MAVQQPLLSARTGLSSSIAVLQLLLLPVAAWVAWRRNSRAGATICLLTLWACLAAFASVTRIQGGIEDHHVFWISGLGLLSAICAAANLLRALLAPRPNPRNIDRATRLAPGSLAVLIIGLGLHGLRDVQSQYDRALRTGAVVRAFTYGVEQHLHNNRIHRPLIRVSRVGWPEAAGVVLQLYKRGVAVTVESHWTPILGRQLAATGREDAEIVFADLPLSVSMTGDQQYVRQARHADLFVFARRGRVHALGIPLPDLSSVQLQ